MVQKRELSSLVGGAMLMIYGYEWHRGALLVRRVEPTHSLELSYLLDDTPRPHCMLHPEQQ